jgi:hypothetical protein
MLTLHLEQQKKTYKRPLYPIFSKHFLKAISGGKSINCTTN